MKSFLPAFLICLSTTFSAQSQRICGTTTYTNQLLMTDPSFKEGSVKAAEQISATLSKKNNSNTVNRDTSRNEIIYIPVVVHVLYKTSIENISDAQVRSQIDALNKDFRRLNKDTVNTPAAFRAVAADARIQFCLAQVDPQGKRTNGIDRKYTNRDNFTTDDAMKFAASGGADSWNSKQYLNIWVVKIKGSSLAYATPPGASAERDGVVIAYNAFGTIEKVQPVFNLGRTATHEIGHWLGLIHVWGDEKCGNDLVDDTPTQESYNFGCTTFPKMSSCSPDNNGDMFMNFMDFSDDACMNMFTKGQAKRMRALFATGNIRNSFLASSACDSLLTDAGPASLPDTSKLAITQPAISISAVKMYPNPVQTMLTVDCKIASTQGKTMSVYNLLGINVYTSVLNQDKTMHNLGNLKAGVYIIKIGDGNETFTGKIIKL